MIEFFARRLIPNAGQINDPAVRRGYGVLCGCVGILLNLLLFAGKTVAGALSGSVAITADAFNNLSDAGSSVVTLLGFRLGAQKADADHPFGHGRMEYVSGLIVSMLILVMGVELGKSSVEKILHPQMLTGSALVLGILTVSILVKLYMCFYNRRIGKKIHSAAMEATALDSLSDSLATGAVLIATVLEMLFHWQLSGYFGVLVSLCILYSGYCAAKDTISPLLGQAPDPEFVREIQQLVLSYPEIRGLHDLVVHDYGPGRRMITLHAEVPSSGDLMQLHDVIDNAERRLREQLHCQAVIHMDPVDCDDASTVRMHRTVEQLLQERMDPRINIHDFRMVSGPSHTNLIFDAVLPYGYSQSNREAGKTICRLIREMEGSYYAVVTVEESYT